MQATYDLAAPSASALQFEVMQEILRLLAPYQVGGQAITPQTVIARGTAVDSLTVMDIIVELEDRFDVVIPMDAAAIIGTIDQLAQTVVALCDRR